MIPLNVNVQPMIVKLGPMGQSFNPRLTRLAPPAGSAIDQDTTHVEADSAMLVAGGIDGDPALEHYLSQSLYNSRTPTTGVGVVIGYAGGVTEPLYVVLSSTQINPNNPGDDVPEIVFAIDPSELEEGSWYYVSATFAENPVPFPTTNPIYLILATDQNYDSQENIYWAWAGSSQNPYDRGKIMALLDPSSGWEEFFNGEYDGLFMTYTEGDPAPCSSHTTQSNCVNAGCYWYDNSCHDSPPTEPTDCSQYTTQATCEAAGCHWYQKYFWEQPSCHDKEQDMIMDYLPFILVGAGGVILIAALAMGRKKPQYYAPPPPHPGYA